MTTRTLPPAVCCREKLAADLATFAHVKHDIADALAQFGWSDVDAFRVLVCVDEAIANAVSHGAGGGFDVRAAYRVSAERATLVLSNTSPGAPCIAKPMRLPCESSEHGRGLILMRALADRIRLSCRATQATVALSFVPHPTED